MHNRRTITSGVASLTTVAPEVERTGSVYTPTAVFARLVRYARIAELADVRQK